MAGYLPTQPVCAAARRARTPALLALALAGPLLSGCPVMQSQDTPVSEIARKEATTGAQYCLYVPSTYDPQRAWALVVTLHGTHGFDDGRRQVKEWKALAEEHEFIVLAPQVESPQGILYVSRGQRQESLERDEKKVLAAVAEVKRQYHIGEGQTMISGFSAGGYPLYYIGLRNPQVFDVLVARSANCDLDILKSIELTDRIRAMPMLIFFGKSGINPAYSRLSPIAAESWAAYRHLREHRCFQARIHPIAGGHERRPEVAYEFWAEHMPPPRPGPQTQPQTQPK